MFSSAAFSAPWTAPAGRRDLKCAPSESAKKPAGSVIVHRLPPAQGAGSPGLAGAARQRALRGRPCWFPDAAASAPRSAFGSHYAAHTCPVLATGVSLGRPRWPLTFLPAPYSGRRLSVTALELGPSSSSDQLTAPQKCGFSWGDALARRGSFLLSGLQKRLPPGTVLSIVASRSCRGPSAANSGEATALVPKSRKRDSLEKGDLTS